MKLYNDVTEKEIPIHVAQHYVNIYNFYVKNYPEILEYIRAYKVYEEDRSYYSLMISDDCPIEIYKNTPEYKEE